MTPRKPGPPLHMTDDADRYPAHSEQASRTADMLTSAITPALETLNQAQKALTEGSFSEERKRLLLLDYLRIAHAQITEGRQIGAEWAMRNGMTQSATGQRLSVSNATTNDWWHHPLHEDALTPLPPVKELGKQ